MVAKEMADHEIGSLPVTREGKYIGIITETGMKDMAGFFLGPPEQDFRMNLVLEDEVYGLTARFRKE